MVTLKACLYILFRLLIRSSFQLYVFLLHFVMFEKRLIYRLSKWCSDLLLLLYYELSSFILYSTLNNIKICVVII